MLEMKELFIKYYGPIGLILSAFSFLHWLLPASAFNAWTLFFIHGAFVVGAIMFFDWLCLRLEGNSILTTLKSKKDLIYFLKNFLIMGIIFGFLLELYIHWIGKFWFYTYWGWGWYLIMFIPGFAGYVFFFLESYLGIKAVLSKFAKKRIELTRGKQPAKLIMFICSVIILVSTIYLLMIQPYRSVDNFFSIDFAPFRILGILPALIIAGFVLVIIMDYFLSKKRGFSFTSSIIKFNIWPFAALLIAGWLVGFVWEYFNVKAFYWQYANSILPDLNMFGFPVSVFLLWPLQYFPIIILYYYLFDREK